MKKLIAVCFCLCICLGVNAQKSVPEIKVGSNLYCTAIVSGQEFPLLLTVKTLSAPYSMAWSVEGYGDGSFETSAKAFESGDQFAQVSQPALGVTKLNDNQTFFTISKAAFKSLSDTKSFTYSGAKFKLKTPESAAVKINGKDADTFHVISEDGKMEFWILNNADFPLIVQSSGLATDIIVTEIK